MLELPYDTTIRWFKYGQLISEATSVIFSMTEPGSYTVEGAPSVCPNFIQSLGLTIAVGFADSCITAVSNSELSTKISLFPNPVKTTLHLKNTHHLPISSIRIWEISSKLFYEQHLKQRELCDKLFDKIRKHQQNHTVERQKSRK